MEHRFITENNNRRLIAIFLGWAMDYRVICDLSVDGYDIVAIWDYVSTDLDSSIFSGYSEIAVIAWSFGVPAAARYIADNPSLPVTARIAVNGTQHPVDDKLGIPEAVFNATLENLSDASLTKFFRRMAGSSERFRMFSQNLPQRDIDSLRVELRVIARREPVIIDWDIACIATDDRIIPAANQSLAWQSESALILESPSPHLPDFHNIISTVITDKDLVAQRFGKAMTSYDENAEVQHIISSRLVDFWNPDKEKSIDLLEIGCGTGSSTRAYIERISARTLKLWDMYLSDTLPGATEIKQCDAETEILNLPEESVDVIFSSSTVQWFNSLPCFLRNASKVLRPGGKIVFSTFGPENFAALYSITGHSPVNPSLKELSRIIPPLLKTVFSLSETIRMQFHDTISMLRHISKTGVNALSGKVSPADIRALIRDYPRGENGEVTLDYNPIYMILQKI